MRSSFDRIVDLYDSSHASIQQTIDGFTYFDEAIKRPLAGTSYGCPDTGPASLALKRDYNMAKQGCSGSAPCRSKKL